MSARCNPLGGRSSILPLALASVLSTIALIGAAPARAQSPFWGLGAEVAPTNLAPGSQGEVVATVSNLGDTEASGSPTPMTITDKLPAGVTPVSVQPNAGFSHPTPQCSIAASTVTCEYAGPLAPYEDLEVQITVSVAPDASGRLSNEVSVHGAGGVAQTRDFPVEVSTQPAAFGLQRYELSPLNEDGTPATQAGSHPFQLTTTIVTNQQLNQAVRQPVALPKDLTFNLPPGLIGNPQAASDCTSADFVASVGATDLCPASSVVGAATFVVYEPVTKFLNKTVPVFNLTPARGEPARFGIDVVGKVFIVIDTAVRSGKDYGVVATVKDVDEVAGLLSAQLTLWGVPGATQHDSARGWECIAHGEYEKQLREPFDKPCPSSFGLPTTPFLRSPSACSSDPSAEPVLSSVLAEPWTEPGSTATSEYTWQEAAGGALGFTGCAQEGFSPSLQVTPEAHAAATPAGLSVDVKVPQGGLLEAGATPESDVRDTTVTLPRGVQVSPSSATGLEACAESQIGFTGVEARTGADQFDATPASCPDASKLGSVRIKTPLLPHELEGSVYLATPAPNGEAGANPFNSLVALYIVAEDPVSGVWVKLAGEGSLDASTGQVSTTFRSTPQVPFEELNVSLFGGERAPLSLPSACGTYAAQATFTPWSGAEPVTALAPAGAFAVESGVGGGACPSAPLAFAPAFTAQSADTNAGAFTHFALEIERPDGEQALSGVTLHLPQGVAALLSKVTPCAEPPAGQEWSCGADSVIGHSSAVSGLGSYPVTLPGTAYLTSGYDGAPFGLLVQTRAKAGPFDLGNVNVRSRINVDPSTAAVTITTDPGPRGEAFPTMIRGIPAQIKKIVVDVDRDEFEFNPTSCAPASVTGALGGSEGASASVSSPFQVANCGALPFAPTLTAATNGHASKANGTSFDVTVTSGGTGAGGVAQSNIAKVALQLPKQLPSRLTTLQKACPEATFDANPAACPEGSNVGTATIHTPVLRDPLSGPAYLVSHGNAAFPDLEFVLQGEGITLVLDGKTQIKNGITYSRFESTPDAPFTSFETVLPAGPYSALTSNVPTADNFSLCGQKLVAPTTITAQNGTVIERQTPVAVRGCAGVKGSKSTKLTNAQKLAKALAACHKRYRHSRAKRARCERQARKRYPVKKAKHKVSSKGKGAGASRHR